MNMCLDLDSMHFLDFILDNITNHPVLSNQILSLELWRMNFNRIHGSATAFVSFQLPEISLTFSFGASSAVANFS